MLGATTGKADTAEGVGMPVVLGRPHTLPYHHAKCEMLSDSLGWAFFKCHPACRVLARTTEPEQSKPGEEEE
jgi:hypothetical protein